MTHEVRLFAKHYLLLTLLLGVGLGGIIWFRSNQAISQVILWVTIGAYTAWGIFHHVVRKNLTTAIVIEYFLVGIIAGLFIQATLLTR